MQNPWRVFRRVFLFSHLLFAGMGTLALAQNPIPLRVQMAEVDATKLVPLIAYEAGIYKKNGLAVDLYISPGARDLQALRDLVIPPQYVKDDPAPLYHGGGSPGVATAGYYATSNPDRVIIATFDPMVHWPIVARAEIKRPEDLKGKRLGILGYGDVPHQHALELAKHMGWNRDLDIELMQRSCDLVTLKQGLVDAVIAPDVLWFTSLAAGLGFHVVVETKDWKTPIAGSGIVTTRTWLRENPETARRYMKSMVEAVALLKKDRDLAYRAMAKWFNITNPEFQKIFYDSTFDMERKPYPNAAGVQRTMELFDSHWMRRHKPEDFYDDSLVRELDQSGYIDSLYK